MPTNPRLINKGEFLTKGIIHFYSGYVCIYICNIVYIPKDPWTGKFTYMMFVANVGKYTKQRSNGYAKIHTQPIFVLYLEV